MVDGRLTDWTSERRPISGSHVVAYRPGACRGAEKPRDHWERVAGTSDGRCSWHTVFPAFVASKRSASSAIKPSARRTLPSTMAATNKFLAQSNKSCTGGEATKERDAAHRARPQHRQEGQAQALPMERMTEHDMIGWFNAAPMGSRQQRMLWA